MGMACRKFVVLTLSLLALSGCDEMGRFNLADGLNLRTQDEAETNGVAARQETVEQDVEVPEVFSVTAEGLWDGRPSLGGVWVAHPDVDQPERVIIRNTANGKSVVGALFRREREMPGPDLQISSDAAQALALVAGSPQELSVTALQRKEVPVETQAPDQNGAVPPPATVTATALDPADTSSMVETAAEGGASALETATRQNAPASAPGGVLEEPYLQVGEFSLKWGANRALRKVRGAGIPAELREDRVDGRPQWRVVAGPAVTTQERTALLDRVRAAGFDDAYPVTN